MSDLAIVLSHLVEVAACLRGRGTHFVSGPSGGDEDDRVEVGGGGGSDFVTVEGKATQSGTECCAVFTFSTTVRAPSRQFTSISLETL